MLRLVAAGTRRGRGDIWRRGEEERSRGRGCDGSTEATLGAMENKAGWVCQDNSIGQ